MDFQLSFLIISSLDIKIKKIENKNDIHKNKFVKVNTQRLFDCSRIYIVLKFYLHIYLFHKINNLKKNLTYGYNI